MKRSDLIYEAYLLFITVVMIMGWVIEGEGSIGFLLIWLIMLGLFQLGHSIIMALSYKENKSLKDNLRLFWAFIPLFIFPMTAIFTAIPMACYFWWLTWRYWRITQQQQPTG